MAHHALLDEERRCGGRSRDEKVGDRVVGDGTPISRHLCRTRKGMTPELGELGNPEKRMLGRDGDN